MRLTYEERIEAILNPEKGPAPANARVIAMFLRDYRPADGSEESRCDLTSLEIRQILEDIAPVPLEDVAAVMLSLGYELTTGVCGEICWRMRCAKTAPEE